MIDLPLNTQATNVGISVQMDTSNPSGIPIPSGTVALYLDVEGNGGVDLSDPNIYSSNPVLHFNLEKSGSSCPTGVTVYLEDGGHWHEVTPSATLDSTGTHTCAYSIEVEHFSSYLIGTGSSGGHDHTDSSSHDSHSTSSHSHSTHAHAIGHEGHESAITQITRDLNIFEIEYDLSQGIARITVGSTGPLDELEVQVYSDVGGFRMAKMVNTQQTGLVSDGMKRYVFEVSLESNETFFRVSVEDSRYNLNQSVKIEGQSGKLVPSFANIHDGTEHESMEHDSMTTAGYEAGNQIPEYEVKFNGDKKTVNYKDSEFAITYEMMGGIRGIEIDEESKSVKFLLDYVTGGDLLLQVPRSLIDADNDNFVVLLEASPERQIDYEIVSSTIDYYTLKVSLPENAQTLTIIGTKVVPEFGVFSILVLVISIASIVIILKTQKHVLQTGTFYKSTKIA
jgi:predicted secreted protein with PEFG-CTERM motif